MLRAILVLCLIAGSRQIQIKKLTVPPSVELGSDAELKCDYELNDTDRINGPYVVTVKWWLVQSRQRLQLYQRMPLSKQPPQSYHNYTLGTVPDSILIKNAEQKHSGVYECDVSNVMSGVENRMNQQLIVYSKGTGPNLTLTEVEDSPDDDDIKDVMILCTAEDITPEAELIITINKNEVKDVADVAGSTHDGLYDYKVNITVSRARIGDAEVSCELFYKNRNISHPPYVNSLHLKKEEIEDESGDEVPSTKEATLGKSVDDPSGSGNTIGSMWVFLLSTLITTHLIYYL